MADVADPVGGSALLEEWTEEIRSRARLLIAKVDELGGAVAAIEQGFVAGRSRKRPTARSGSSRKDERLVVGVNTLTEEDSASPALLTWIRRSNGSRSSACGHFGPLETRRRHAAPSISSRKDVSEGRNVMPGTIAAVSGGATLGEIVSVYKSVYGEHPPGR